MRNTFTKDGYNNNSKNNCASIGEDVEKLEPTNSAGGNIK